MQSAEQRRLIRIAAAMNSKARRLGIQGHISWHELAVIAQVTPECAYCGIGLEQGQGTFDHALALERRGANDTSNIVRCCITCNRSKFTKTPEEFAVAQQLLARCAVCETVYKPRWAEWVNGRARTCSHACAGKLRWA